jgi:nicotinate-nucleotide--dimethylbenzimidazole phosphoribosyltransferase
MANSTAFPEIPPFHTAAAEAAARRQDILTKPTGSLGRLEALSIRLAGMTGVMSPDLSPALIAVFAADHGVAANGVSAYPREVTAQMVYNYARGGAVINTLARTVGAELVVVDAGVAEDLSPDLQIVHRKVRRGTADWTREPAMSPQETRQAIAIGAETVTRQRVGLLAVGEMGIGNTTTAAALAAALLEAPVEDLVGRGTGVDDAGLERKRAAVAAGLARLTPGLTPFEILSELGGLEIAAMTGAILAAAQKRIPVVLDGFISTCAALVAEAISPGAKDYLIASHRSQERGHLVLLERLGLEPLLDLGLRLGEGSGAALAIPVIRASRDILRDVATFDQAGVSDRDH